MPYRSTVALSVIILKAAPVPTSSFPVTKIEQAFAQPNVGLDNRRSGVYYRREIEGRISTMAKQTQQRAPVLQGTLDMLILRTLIYGPAHGHQIGKHIQRTTNDFLQMQHGSLYPALHRLERQGWVTSKWEMAPDRNREFKYYRLTEKGGKQLLVEESQWKQMMDAVARVMWPTPEES
jgi:PadR family transcriptional regulator, regulatory protein PadR